MCGLQKLQKILGQAEATQPLGQALFPAFILSQEAITDPCNPSRVVVRRGKRNIIGMDGVANEEDYDQYGNPMREDDDDDEVYVKRRINTTLPKKNRTPWKRQSHNEGLNYSSTNKKGKKLTQK